jgi:hypothetical protein
MLTANRYNEQLVNRIKEKSMSKEPKKVKLGNTVEYETGAVRSSDAEPYRFDLISPVGLKAVARACAEGAKKYSDFNWEAGMPVNDLLNHAIRHIYEYLSGDRDEDHLGHAAWNVIGAIHSVELWPDINEGALREQGCKPPVKE